MQWTLPSSGIVHCIGGSLGQNIESGLTSPCTVHNIETFAQLSEVSYLDPEVVVNDTTAEALAPLFAVFATTFQ